MLGALACSGVPGLNLAVLQAPAPGWPASAGPAPLSRPAPVQEDLIGKWLERRRQLRIRFGASAGVLGISVVGLALFVAFPRCSGDEESVCAPPVGAIVTGVAVAASLVSTIVYAVRLTVHNERRPPARRLGFGASGLSVRF